MKCGKCNKQFKQTPYQIRKQDHQCPSCRRQYTNAWRQKRRDLGLPIPRWKGAKEYEKKYRKGYQSRPEVKKRRAKAMRKYRNDPKLRVRHLARDITKKAINSGKIKRGRCIVCKIPNAQAHHEDYSKPLQITWLCASHHRQHHARAKEEK